MKTLQRRVLKVNMDDFRETLKKAREGDILDFDDKGRELVVHINNEAMRMKYPLVSIIRMGNNVIQSNSYGLNPDDKISIDGQVEFTLHSDRCSSAEWPVYQEYNYKLSEVGL